MGAHLEGAALRDKVQIIHLKDGEFIGSEFVVDEDDVLREAVGLPQWLLNRTFGDNRTVLPAGLTPPAHWSAATPDAPDN